MNPDKHVVAAYYEGVLGAMRGRVGRVSATIEHGGEKGRANEQVAEDLLRDFLPAQFSLSTGFVVDREQAVSRQCDIVIYDDESCPRLFGTDSPRLFPIEAVDGVVEVKTTLTKAEARGAMKAIRSVCGLTTAYHDGPETHPAAPFLPAGFVLAFRASVGKDTAKPETVKKWLDQLLDEMKPDYHERVRLVYVVDPGVYYGFPKPSCGRHTLECAHFPKAEEGLVFFLWEVRRHLIDRRVTRRQLEKVEDYIEPWMKELYCGANILT